MARGCSNNRVERCAPTDLGAGGVRIGETAIRPDKADHAFGNSVSDCLIAFGGQVFNSAIGIWIGQSYDNRIAHNHIHDFYYTGISVGWTWGYNPAALAKGNVIEFNLVQDIGKPRGAPEPALSDLGGIYTLGPQPGTVIRNNVFHEIAARKYGGWGIYFDEGSTGIVAENNLVYRTTHGGFHQHYGKENVVRNNIFAFGRDAQLQRTRVEAHRSFTFEHNIVYWDKGNLLAGNPSGNLAMDHNVFWRTDKAPIRFGKLDLAQWQKSGQDMHSAVVDPLFADVTKAKLQDASPALAFFKPFDISGAGPRAQNK